MPDRRDIEKLRRLDLTESTSSGAEAVRLTAQYRQPLAGQSREQRRAVLQTWQDELAQTLARHGGEIVPGSLSLAGQTVEAIVPVEKVSSAEAELAAENVRIDLVTPRQVIEP
jgi:hypothetical protein